LPTLPNLIMAASAQISKPALLLEMEGLNQPAICHIPGCVKKARILVTVYSVDEGNPNLNTNYSCLVCKSHLAILQAKISDDTQEESVHSG
jgi:hypothetical protein